MAEKVFIPHDECGAANGGCFEEGRCLMKCQPRLPAADANAQLATAVRLFQRTHDSVLQGSMDEVRAIWKAQNLIQRLRRSSGRAG